MRKAALIAGTLGILLGAQPGFAQEGQGPDGPQPTAGSTQSVEAKALEGLPVYSSDNQKVGAVKSVERNSDGSVGTLQAEIEGFLGLGTSSVRLTPDQFKHAGDRVVLSQTAAQVRGVPDASYKSFDRSGSGAR